MLFKKPAAMRLFPSNRYTLELIRDGKQYTVSYFPDAYKEQVLFLGSESGRNSAKMQEVTPRHCHSLRANDLSGSQIGDRRQTDTNHHPTFPDDFYAQDDIEYMREPYKDPVGHCRYVFGEITAV